MAGFEPNSPRWDSIVPIGPPTGGVPNLCCRFLLASLVSSLFLSPHCLSICISVDLVADLVDLIIRTSSQTHRSQIVSISVDLAICRSRRFHCRQISQISLISSFVNLVVCKAFAIRSRRRSLSPLWFFYYYCRWFYCCCCCWWWLFCCYCWIWGWFLCSSCWLILKPSWFALESTKQNCLDSDQV